MTEERRKVLEDLVVSYKEMGKVVGIDFLKKLEKEWQAWYYSDNENFKICYEAVVIALWELM